MRFCCQVNDLNNGLSIATHALSPRSTLPILEGVFLEAIGDKLTLTCSDGAMTISTCMDAEIEEEGKLVMPGRLFCDVVRKLPQGTLSFSSNENRIATLRCCGSRTTIAARAGDLFPMPQDIPSPKTVLIPQPTLRNMILQTSFAVSVDEMRKILTGCLLEINLGEARMVATDGFRLAVRIQPLPDAVEPLRAVIPGKLLLEISKIVDGGEEDDPVELSFGDKQLRLRVNRTQVFATLLEGEYINYRQIIPAAFKTTVRVLDREQLMLCVERASLMARESKTNLVKLSISPDLMVITSNSEMGDVYEEIQTQTEGEPLEIAFNVKYLSDVIKVVDDDQFLLCFNSGISPCVVRPLEDGGYTYMVLPCRLNA